MDPPSAVFFDLFLQWFVVFLIEVIHILCLVYSQIFDFFEAIINGVVFKNSFSIYSLLVYKKATDILKVDFVSCYFAEAVYGV
jgi:hypothetical protein